MQDLQYQFQIIQAIRNFFVSKNFIDVLVPPLVPNPGMETHIHPFKVISANNNNEAGYLHTSPEFYMKHLLSNMPDENIFTLGYCFRDEPSSPIHRNQFIMLEWYRKKANLDIIIKDTINLTRHCIYHFKKSGAQTKLSPEFEVTQLTVQELFFKYCNFDILEYSDKNLLKDKIRQDFPEVPLPFSECSWDDYFFLLFLNKIEPELVNYEVLILKEYPAQLAALSTLKESDKRVCNRFEFYIRGVEIANCFNELTDLTEQKVRFNQQATEKERLYGYCLPYPNVLYNSLEKGLPESSGIALGVERLLSSIIKTNNPFFI